jgi:hypothetical protein
MARTIFKSQNSCEKFHEKLNRLHQSYKDGQTTPVEAFESLIVDFKYGKSKAAELVETWRKGIKDCIWRYMGLNDLLQGDRFGREVR